MNDQSNLLPKSEVEELYQRIEDLERRLTIITQQLPHLSRQLAEYGEHHKKWVNFQKSATKRDPSTHMSTIVKLEEQINTLQEQLNLCHRLEAPNLPTAITIDEIASGMGEIRNQIKNLFDCDTSGISFPQSGPLDDALMSLIRYCGISRNKRDLRTHAELQKFIDIVGQWSVLQAITAAALCGWVFESDFPNFDKEKSSLLQMYRRKLASQES